MKRRRLPIPPYILFLFLLLAFMVLYAFTAQWHHPTDLAASNLRERLKMPSVFGLSDSGYLLGSDYLGRDIFTRVLYATQTSLSVAFVGLIAAAFLGTSLGILAALCSGWVDNLVVFLINVICSLPGILVGIVISTIFGAGQEMLILLIALVHWTGFARQVRGQVMQIKQENFIECSRALGSSTLRILFEHIIVNIASPMIVTATLNLSGIILLESTLSFLGLGIQPPATSLGVMVATGRNQLTNSWWLSVVPIVVIVVIIMCISLIGDWLRDKLDPKLQNKS